MKTIKRYLAFVIAFMMIFAVSCGEEGGEERESSSETNEIIATTDDYVVKNGVSPYRILVPDGASKEIDFAAEELGYFFGLATGWQLEVVKDDGDADPSGRYLAIGETSLAKSSGVDLSYDTLGTDGYQLKTYGKSVVMAGNTDRSSLYSVYGYLKYQFDLEIYTTEVFTYKEKQTAKLVDLAVTDIPDLPFRSGGTFLAEKAGIKALGRYRMRDYTDMVQLWGHAHFTLLPPSKYWEEHPYWYNNSSDPTKATQLAFENEEMWDTFADNLIEEVRANPDKKFFVLGIEDNSKKCCCDVDIKDEKTGKYICGPTKFNEMKNANGGTDSAVQALFLNYVVRKVNAYTAVNFPDKDFQFAMFAYLSVEEPPVVYDPATGKYVPGSDAVVLEDNLGVSIAPILANTCSHGYMDAEYNPTTKRIFEGWQAVSKKFMVWGYSTNFGDYLTPFNNFGAYKANYMKYKDMGVEHLYEQGCQYPCPNYYELRQYLISKLSWDTSLDNETLIRNFMKAYYRDGYEPMYEYFTLMRMKLQEVEDLYDIPLPCDDYDRAQCSRMMNEECFPKTFIDKCEALTAKALAAVDNAGDEEARYAIEKDRMPLRYLALSIHKSAYDSALYTEMVRDFEKICHSMNCYDYSEGGRNLSELIDNWLVS